MSSIKSILMQKMKGCDIYRIIPLVSNNMIQFSFPASPFRLHSRKNNQNTYVFTTFLLKQEQPNYLSIYFFLM